MFIRWFVAYCQIMTALSIRMSRLTFILIICLLQIFTQSVLGAYNLKEVDVAASDGKLRIFTNEDMRLHDGSEETKPIYMGIKGVVFDVSTGRRFYGKGAPYNVLVGKDSTRAVAKMSLEPQDLTHDISDLSDGTLKSLDETFEQTYMAKYPVVGYMDYLVNQYPEKFAGIKQEL